METPLVLIEGIRYRELRYYSTPTRPYWKFIKAPNDSIGDYVFYLKEKLSRANEIYYLREDEVQNRLDPNDIVLKTLRSLGTEETCLQYNPRLILYHWRILPDNQ